MFLPDHSNESRASSMTISGTVYHLSILIQRLLHGWDSTMILYVASEFIKTLQKK